MDIGLPLEIMSGETRVGLTPDACESLISAGHAVYLETGAGSCSSYDDNCYQQVGVVIMPDAKALYAKAELVVKVKQPLAQDLQYLQARHILFSYLHLAANLSLAKRLCETGLTAIPFESVRDDRGDLPLLRPMSAIAGRIAVMRGASLLFHNRGGSGVLLGGVDGAQTGMVLVLGAGVAGSHAVATAMDLGAQVHVVDLNEQRLASLKSRYPQISTHLSSMALITQLCRHADLIVGAVLRAGQRAPVVLTEHAIQQMRHGSVIVDIAIDQGGCVEGIQPTSSDALCYLRYGILHSAVPNMPAATPRTSSQSLASAILPYVHLLAADGLNKTVLQQAVAVADGEIKDPLLLASG